MGVTNLDRLKLMGQAADDTLLDIVGAAITTGKVFDLSDLSALTTGTIIHVDASGDTQTSGKLLHLDSASTKLTSAGRLILSDHQGNAGVSAVLNEFKSAAADETTIVRVTASAALAAGVGLDISASSMTTGTGIDVGALDALTTGIGVNVESGATAITGAGRLLMVDHTGTTSTSGVLAEIKSAATDETVIARVTASAALAAGVVLDLSAASATTATVLDIGGLDALTTGTAVNVVSDSADVSARNLVYVHNDNTAATSAVPVKIRQDATGTAFDIDSGGTSYFTITNVGLISKGRLKTIKRATNGDVTYTGAATTKFTGTGSPTAASTLTQTGVITAGTFNYLKGVVKLKNTNATKKVKGKLSLKTAGGTTALTTIASTTSKATSTFTYTGKVADNASLILKATPTAGKLGTFKVTSISRNDLTTLYMG